ncbi:3-oxoacyl-[acyl-carrier-protein] synthase III C-terminal domain-containing protein [Vibrio sp. AND4]|uniref:3-oxoacyl-[acyl-carrier-protein] synthase III C-terminal domain-containing protein n=1 Tax=Vibrio sp. AND4 TaxID=314289 RepID=UPI00015F2C8A|nr:3-oxoacyl-[acyl-carrier-protein] synthase III C-terminal domain-containing protein [Vibrio sp. AND4]EDP58804.1 3-oxoacyl-[acyl-carrier-protein] synthase III family protein [Vibrio sp. AND4]
MTKTINFGCIGYELGETCINLEDNISLCSDRKSQLFLRTMGFGTYYKTERTLGEIAQKSIEQSLEKSNLSPKDIDLVIYSSSTFGDRHGDAIDKEIARCLTNVGLEKVYPLGVYLSQCNNFFAALDIATQYIHSGRHQTILMVFTDRVLDESTRFKNLAINSDAAASCVLSTRSDLGLPLTVSGQNIKTHLTDADMINPNDNSLDKSIHDRYLTGISSVFGQMLTENKVTVNDINQVICHNFSYSALRQIATAININESLIFKENIQRFGHAYTCDTLINLNDYMNKSDINHEGQKVGVISTGLYFWGSALFTVKKEK